MVPYNGVLIYSKRNKEKKNPESVSVSALLYWKLLYSISFIEIDSP